MQEKDDQKMGKLHNALFLRAYSGTTYSLGVIQAHTHTERTGTF